MIDRYSSKVNELKMMEPLFFSDNIWFIDITTSKLQTPSTFHGVEEFMLKVILLAIDRSKGQCEASLHVTAITHEIFSIGFKNYT